MSTWRFIPVFLLVSVATVLGQKASAESPSNSANAGSDRQAPAITDANGAGPGNNVTARAGALVGRSGGSLFRAARAAGAGGDAPGGAPAQFSLYAVPEKAPKVLKKHDLVQIIVNEVSAATSKAQNDLKKNVELQAEIAQMIKLKLGSGSIYGLPTPTATPGIDFTGARTFHGEGEMDRSDSLTARLTAEIIDVKPNGILILQARKRIKTDDEDQQFVMSGTCRAEDISTDNTVLSSQLYDLSLQKNSKGDVRESTERGRLPKLLDFLNPF